MWCVIFCGASVRCWVRWCFLCCCVVSWSWPCSPSAFSVLRTCSFAPPGAYLPPLVCVSCLEPVGVSALCLLVLCFAVLCCCFVSCRAVSCCASRVVWCCAAFPRAAAPCCVLCRARWHCAVLSCAAPFAWELRFGATCCAVPLCAVLVCFVPSDVRWRYAVDCVLCCAVLCCAVLADVCCAAPSGVVSGCALLCCPRCGLLFRVGRGAVRCAVPPGAVLDHVVSCCAVLCSAGVHCAVRVVLSCVVSRCVVPLRALACPRVLCGALGALCFAGCSAVLLCFVLCLGVCCLAALCCAVGVVSCSLVRPCVPVCCALSLGAVLRCVAWWCCVGCSAIAHCAVCVVLCCFSSRSMVLLRAVPCPWVLCRAVGCCAARFGLCCVALCCVCCAVCNFPLCCGVSCFLLLSVVLLAPCGVALCARLPPCIFENRKNCFPGPSRTARTAGFWHGRRPAGTLPGTPQELGSTGQPTAGHWRPRSRPL